MNITIQAVGFSASERLTDFIQKKANKLDQYFENIVNAEVKLKLEKSNTLENKIVEISLNVPGNDLFAKKNAKTFEQSVDLTIEALKKQVVKYKERIREK